ncbi:MAG: ATP phosphoribosyltransferase [Candidatus Omnitrophica bacterium]|nr:ATP phosphoribosyltransferase [Candidatus Omnitrophota bacterium]
MKKNKLRIGLPKGSLQDSTVALLKKAGYCINVSSRSYFPTVDDPDWECILLRAQEIPVYVQKGVLDCGITGADWVLEHEAAVVMVAELMYAKQTLTPVRWVLAVPEKSSIQCAQDLQGKRVATELVQVTKRYFEKHGVRVDVEFSWGATEAKVPELVDAIVELTETGSSLRAHNLKIIDTLCRSTTQFIAYQGAWDDTWKREKMQNIAMLVQGALQAEEKVGLKMNVAKDHLEKIIGILPALRNPTVSELSRPGWIAVEIVTDEKAVRALIPQLKKAGAEGIIEYPLTKVIP